MIEKYELKRINNEEVLFLYLNLHFEFSFFNKFNNEKREMVDIVKKFIKKNNIVFKGNIVNLIIGGVLVGNVFLNNDITSSSYALENNQYVNKEVIEKISDTSIIDKILKEDKKNIELEKKILVTSNKEKSISNKSNNTNTVSKKNNTNTKQSSPKENTNTSNDNIQNKNNSNDIIKDEDTTTNSKVEVDNNIYVELLQNSKKVQIELEEYIIGVVGAEMPASFHVEALKAQAVIARTYALKAKSQGKTLKANESNQSYKTVDELKKLWGSNFSTYYSKITKAVSETKGMYLSYNGNYIEAVYHSTSNGQTENSKNVWGNSYPYLVSVASPYDNMNSSFLKNMEFSYAELTKLLGFTVDEEVLFTILGKTEGNRVDKIIINEKTYTGVNLRNILGLRSADFDIEKTEKGLAFTTRGYGHGVGLSQYGANGYAKNGYSFSKILSHYYPGTVIKNL